MTGTKTVSYADEKNENELVIIKPNSKVLEMTETSETCPELDFEFTKKPVYDFLKRAADIFLSFLAIVVLSPIMLIACIAVMIKDPGNPFFSQERVGKDGKIFKIYKIRSMYKDAEEQKVLLMSQNESSGAVFKMRSDPRVLGRVGNVIRRTSIDELPQLINILKGDMSVIGPRPFVPDEQENIGTDRLLVKPGLSCYWQVSGKNSLSAEMSEYYDKKYIMDRSFFTDVKIIFRTIGVVFRIDNN